MNLLKRAVKSLVNAAGYDLHRINPAANASVQLCKAFDRFGIDLVFDVGANIGSFGTDLRSAGYQGELVSFEPLSTAHAILLRTAHRDAMWQVAPRCAIGDYDGEVEINISGNSHSSSVLPMTPLHASAAQGSAYVGAEKASICRLDSVAPRYLKNFSRPFLKIDTQGFEWQVLDGARETLPHVQGVLCEMSLVTLYEGQRLWKDMMHRLESEGFELWSIQRAFADLRDGRTLQIDATFFRTNMQ